MRLLVVLVVVWPLTASAEVRLGTHAGGGIEAAMVKAPHPEGIAELGAIVAVLPSDKRWGFAAGVARVGRGYDDVANEWKLDAGLCIANKDRTFRAIIGVGMRTLTIPGGESRPESTIRGIDLIRIDDQIQIVRRGPIALDFYFGWTLGVYHGTRYEDRFGDMVQPTRDFTGLTTAYLLGLSTSVVWN